MTPICEGLPWCCPGQIHHWQQNSAYRASSCGQHSCSLEQSRISAARNQSVFSWNPSMLPVSQHYLVLGIQQGFGQTERHAPHPTGCNQWQNSHPKHTALELHVSSDLCSRNQCFLCAEQASPEQTSDKQRQLEHSSFQTSHRTAHASSCVPC